MKATEVLKKQHKDVRDMFKRLEKLKDLEAKYELFEDLATNLVAHDTVERELFYPACSDEMGMTDELGEALVEHGVVEFSLYQADRAQGGDDFKYKCSVLKELLEHHLAEEEKVFLPKVEKALSKARLEELGQELQEQFEEAKEEDFRTVLHDNLQQVLRGATKVSPQRTSVKRGKAARKTLRMSA